MKTLRSLSALCLIVIAVAQGCAAWQRRVLTDLKECAAPAIAAGAADLYGAVKGIITQGAPNWAEQLTTLEGIGEKFVVCAALKVKDELAQKRAQATLSPLPPAAMRSRDAVDVDASAARVDAYLRSKHL